MSSQFLVPAALPPVANEQKDRVNPKLVWTRQESPSAVRPAASYITGSCRALYLITFIQKVKGSLMQTVRK